MRLQIPVAVLLIAIVAVPSLARAAIINTTGQVVVIPAPPDARTGHLESSTLIRAFAERQNISLAQPVSVDITLPGTSPTAAGPNLSAGVITAGTLVSSYFLHYDQPGTPGSPSEVIGSVTFNSDILGIILVPQSLDASDLYPGLPTTVYASGDGSRGLELTPQLGLDSITLSADRRTISLDLHNVNNSDDLRVITVVPEPSTIVLLAAGGLFMLARLFRRRGL